MPRGLFISFEGSEGGGKSTQIRTLAARLQESGRTVVVTREPGGTPIGERIRHLLQFDAAAKAMTPEAELLLFTASRAQLCRELIQPALAQGSIVLADRFLDSTTVYQGVARAIPAETVFRINRFATGDVIPDITFVLDLDPATSRQRIAKRNGSKPTDDRMEQQSPEFYEAVRRGYLDLAKKEPERVRLIDARRPEDVVAKELWKHVGDLLSLG